MFTFLKQLVRGFVLVALCAVLVPVLAFGTAVGALIVLPLPAELPEPKPVLPSQSTKIFDINGDLIGELEKYDKNIPVAQEDIPLILKQAVIAAEDRSYYEHQGIDLSGMARAFYLDMRNQSAVQGGSTITQQYVKKAYTNEERTVGRKIKEAILASQLDRQVDKDTILYKYFSAVYFGGGAYGIGAAADSYFHKSVKDLTASEAALLVGIIPAPSAWEPRKNPTIAEAKRVQVLNQMADQGYLTPQQKEESLAQKVWLETQGDPPGPVTKVFKLESAPTEYPYFVDYVRRYLEKNYGVEKVLSGGLRVQTTLDRSLQAAAEQSVASALKGTSAPLEMSLVSIEPQTGFVKALVGGRDFQNSAVNLALGNCPSKPGPKAKIVLEANCWSKDMVQGGGSGRQPGSSFKPIVLAAAYESGMQPQKIYSAPPVYRIPNCKPTPQDNCQVRNAEGESSGPTTVKNALVHSYNTVYVPLANDVGLKKVGEMAQKLGLDDFFYSPTIHGTAGIFALGTTEASPLEMASAYGVFANHGKRLPPTPVVKVVDISGKVYEDNAARDGEQVISEAVADNVTDAMKEVVEHGTGYPNANIGRPAAGKTGTTEGFMDAWFVGFTPTLSTSVWMGNSDSASKRINYKGNTRVYGGSIPAKTWGNYMKEALERVPKTDFRDPAPIKKVNTDVVKASDDPAEEEERGITPKQVRNPTPTPDGSYDKTGKGIPPPPGSFDE